MSGHFHKIIGKTITGVYCRENEVTPKGQVFITFDDGTYFEMYTMLDEIKGIKGLNPGDLDHVVGLNHPKGKTLCLYPESQKIMMWVPHLKSNPEKQMALGVPTDERIKFNDDYWQLLLKHIQSLIIQLPEHEASNLIEYYLLDGTNIVKEYKSTEWAENIIEQIEFETALDDLYELDFEEVIDSKTHGNLLMEEKSVTLNNLLKAVQFKFTLMDEDIYIIDEVDKLITGILRENNLTPHDIVGLGKMLYVLRRLPIPTQNAFISLSLITKFNSSVSIDVQITDNKFSVLASGDGVDFLDWSLYLDGVRETEGGISIFEEDIFREIGSISVDGGSDFVMR